MHIQLSAQFQMPLVGFGTFGLDDRDVQTAVGHAIAAGYRHIDTAEAYGNETGVGGAIRRAAVAREQLFITTKLWPGDRPAKGYQATIDALDASLNRLALDYVDLYLIHAPLAVDRRLDQWRALLDLQQQGKARAVGVSNYGVRHIEEIGHAGLPQPAVNQIELHPWSQKPALVGYLRANDIAIVAYSSLAPLTTWRAGPNEISGKSPQIARAGEPTGKLLRALAQKYAVGEAQILLRWAVQQGYGVLPKSRDPLRIRQNIDLFSFAIDDADMQLLAELDQDINVAWRTGDPTKLP